MTCASPSVRCSQDISWREKPPQLLAMACQSPQSDGELLRIALSVDLHESGASRALTYAGAMPPSDENARCSRIKENNEIAGPRESALKA